MCGDKQSVRLGAAAVGYVIGGGQPEPVFRQIQNAAMLRSVRDYYSTYIFTAIILYIMLLYFHTHAADGNVCLPGF
jgi:hypothetical protein